MDQRAGPINVAGISSFGLLIRAPPRRNTTFMAIPINVTGRATSGDAAGMFIRVESAEDSGSGLLILGSSNPGFAGTAERYFDYWVESAVHLDQFFAEAAWDVEWAQAKAYPE
ncbi:MAG: hypothetical protein ABI725_05945 [Chloroflexota bacterium]